MKSEAWFGFSNRLVLTGLLLIAIMGLTSPVYAQGVDTRFREGLKAFEEGRYEDAVKAFTEVLKANPSSEEAMALSREAGDKFIVDAMARGGKLATLIGRLLARSEAAALKARQDEEKMREMIRTMLNTESYIEQFTLVEKLVQMHGHYAIPLLIEVLGDAREQEKRVRAIGYIRRLGEEGVLAVVELLESPNVLLQQNASIILGMIRDRRAIPALQRAVEKSQDSGVRNQAGEALTKMGWSGKATDAYSRLAEAYLKEYPLVMQTTYKDWVVWKWREDRLSKKIVQKYSWNEQVAEELAYDGLAVDPNDQRLWAQLVNVVAQQVAEVDNSLRILKQNSDAGLDTNDDLLADLEKEKARLVKARGLIASAGRDTLFAALAKALEDNNSPVAVLIIEALEHVNIDGSGLPASGEVTISPVNNPGGLPGLADQTLVTSTIVAEQKPEMADKGEAKPAMKKGDKKPAAKKPMKKADKKADPKKADAKKADPKKDENLEGPKKDETKKKKNRRRVSQLPGFGKKREAYALLGGILPQAAKVPAVAATSSASGGAALCAALTYGDKRVRFAAAMALARLNPQKAFANVDKVVENLAEAVALSGQRVILVVEPERNARNEIVGKLTGLGYMAFGVESGNNGLDRAKRYPVHDLVIVSSELNTKGSADEPLQFQFVRDLREDYRTKAMKVMILSPSARESEMRALVDSEENVADVVTSSIDRVALRDKIRAVFASEAAQRDEKARADKVSIAAAMSVSSLMNKVTQFKIEAVTEALLGNCTGRPDPVRIAAMKGLEAIGVRSRDQVVPTLLNVFKNKDENAIEVRVAAANAIGEAIKRSAIQGDVFQTLKAACGEESGDIYNAALIAVGKADLTAEQRLMVWQEQRPSEGGAGK